ncbi:hypothetical protein KXV85_000827, partial [Aspergillus fumigatus]
HPRAGPEAVDRQDQQHRHRQQETRQTDRNQQVEIAVMPRGRQLRDPAIGQIPDRAAIADLPERAETRSIPQMTPGIFQQQRPDRRPARKAIGIGKDFDDAVLIEQQALKTEDHQHDQQEQAGGHRTPAKMAGRPADQQGHDQRGFRCLGMGEIEKQGSPAQRNQAEGPAHALPTVKAQDNRERADCPRAVLVDQSALPIAFDARIIAQLECMNRLGQEDDGKEIDRQQQAEAQTHHIERAGIAQSLKLARDEPGGKTGQGKAAQRDFR